MNIKKNPWTFFIILNSLILVFLGFQNFTILPKPNNNNSNIYLVKPLTRYINFKNYCFQYVTNWANGQNVIGNASGACAESNGQPMLFSVTHENPSNHHRGSLNYSPTRTTYMNDFNLKTDLGRWINNGIYSDANQNYILGLSFDSLNFNDINSTTGWPVRYGHLFYGLNDLSVTSTLDHNIYVEFDIRIRGSEVGIASKDNTTAAFPNGFSGYHIAFGTTAVWQEQNLQRSNKAHTLEITLSETPGYATTYGDPTTTDPHCLDAKYDRCFFDTKGVYAEGKYLSYSDYLKNTPLKINSDEWTHIKIPFSDILKSLNWMSRPSDWSKANMLGVYLAIESMGATRAWFEIKNYQIYSAEQKPSILGLPLGFIRLGVAGLLSYPTGVCSLPEPSMMQAYAWNQMDYDKASQVQQNQIPQGYVIKSCPAPSNGIAYKGLFRVGNGSYLQRGQFYCSIANLKQADYDKAPQVFVPDAGLIYTGACR